MSWMSTILCRCQDDGRDHMHVETPVANANANGTSRIALPRLACAAIITPSNDEWDGGAHHRNVPGLMELTPWWSMHVRVAPPSFVTKPWG